MLLAFGIASALLSAQRSGQGQVVDAAMVEGASLLAAMFAGMLANKSWSEQRAANVLDSGAPFYDTYETKRRQVRRDRLRSRPKLNATAASPRPRAGYRGCRSRSTSSALAGAARSIHRRFSSRIRATNGAVASKARTPASASADGSARRARTRTTSRRGRVRGNRGRTTEHGNRAALFAHTRRRGRASRRSAAKAAAKRSPRGAISASDIAKLGTVGLGYI